MSAEAEAAFAWLRRQRDDPRQSSEVRARSAAAGMLELRCGKDVRLQLSVPHRDKLHELYCRTVARRVGKEEPTFLRALFCLLLRYGIPLTLTLTLPLTLSLTLTLTLTLTRYDSVGGAGHQVGDRVRVRARARARASCLLPRYDSVGGAGHQAALNPNARLNPDPNPNPRSTLTLG